MYTYVKAVMMSNGKYKDTDVRTLTLKQIIDDYSDGYIELRNPTIQGPIFVYYSAISSNAINADFNQTVSAWLSTNGNKTIPGSEYRPMYSGKSVSFANAWDYGYKINSVPKDTPLSGSIPEANNEDLIITPTQGSLTSLKTRALVSVNNFIHYSTATNRGLRVVDGGRSLHLNNDNQVGILSFDEVGDLTQVPIREDMIFPSTGTADLKNGVYINAGVPLTGKSVFIIMGGIMHIADNTYSVVNDLNGIIYLDISKIDIVRKVAYSYKHIDLADLGAVEPAIDLQDIVIDNATDKPGSMNPIALQSNSVIKKYLSLSQSFIVILDTPNISCERIAVETTGLHGVYETYTPERYPLVDCMGKVREYAYVCECGYHTLSTVNVERGVRTFETVDYMNDLVATNINQVERYEVHDMDLLKISTWHTTYKKETT